MVTRHGYGELVNAIALAVFRRDIPPAAAREAFEVLDQDIAEGRLRLVEILWRRALDRAVALSKSHTPELGTRSLDVLHVAAALVLQMSSFVTYDGRQSRLARAVGLRVAQP